MEITKSYRDILNSMLDKVPNNIDKRDGSIVFYALAPSAVDSAEIRLIADYIYNQLDVNNKTGDNLDRYVSERSPISRREAGSSIKIAKLTGDGANDVEVGERFTHGTFFFEVVERLGNGEYKLAAETPGTETNSLLGRIVPVNNLVGIESAQFIDTLLPGYDEESDESLRDRYVEYKQKPPTSGNIFHYKLWAKEIVGVGEVEVNPCWQGPNTVQVIITDNNMDTPSKELINKVQDYIDPGGTGEGRGTAPIGAKLTVSGAEPVKLDIEIDIIHDDEIKIEDIINNISLSIKGYLKKIAFQDSYVSYSKLAAVIIMTEGVKDIRELRVNGGQSNIGLEREEVPILGEVVLIE